MLPPREIAALSTLATLDDPDAADRLKLKLGRLVPSAEARDLLQRLLDQTQSVDCRLAEVAAQLALGYPWALEVVPENLEWLRRETERLRHLGLKSRLATVFSALASGGWSLFWLKLLTLSGPNPNPMVIPFVIGLVHAIAALVTAVRASPTRPRSARARIARWYRFLGWAVVCGPACSMAAAAAINSAAFMLGMLFAIPAMVTAGCCAIASWALEPRRSRLRTE